MRENGWRSAKDPGIIDTYAAKVYRPFTVGLRNSWDLLVEGTAS